MSRDKFKLEYDIINQFKHVNNEKIGLTIKANEAMLDYQALYRICKLRIKKSHIVTYFNTKFLIWEIKNHNSTILS